LHPLLEDICADTYGVMIYQEQVMAAASKLAGYSLAQGDLLRRAMGKKDKEKMAKERRNFIEGCARTNKIPEKKANAIFDLLEKFAGYGFNKSHSAAYGVISYQTAFLKAHYPVEFMAGLLSNEINNTEKISVFVGECKRMGISILPPDINKSGLKFTPETWEGPQPPYSPGTEAAPTLNAIRYGLAAIKNVGEAAMAIAIRERDQRGEFSSLEDFCTRLDSRLANRKMLESLIKAGAFDSFQDARKGLVLVHEQAVDAVIDIKRNEAIGQDSLFGGDTESEAVFDVPVPAGEWDKSTLLNFEREMLGLYVSDHPLFGIEHIIARESDCSLADLMADEAEPRPRAGDRSDAQIVKIGGILSGVQRKVTKQGNQWAAATLEDLGGAIEVLFFPQTYQLYATSIAEDAVVVVKGKVDRRDDVPKLIAMDLAIPDLSVDDSGPFVVSMPVARCVPPVVERLREVLVTHPGPTEVHLKLRGHERTTLVRLDDKLRVATSPALIGDLKQLLGPACVS